VEVNRIHKIIDRGGVMKIYLAMFNDGSGWQPIRHGGNGKSHQLCIYESHDNASKGINFNRYKYSEGTEFKIVTFGEIENE